MTKITKGENQFTFNISLSVLNHLGRHLYRSFATVLGEAISNAWDADARNVWIFLDRAKNKFVIKDDGIGMTADDFQHKFLKIGYSKRRGNQKFSKRGRPFIGRKGIGKLALLSCAKRVTVISRTRKGDFVGGVIDNSALDKAITNDLNPQEYQLEIWETKKVKRYIRGHKNGTIVLFEGLHEGVRGSLEHLKKVIALYFKFSLIDKAFNIYLDNKKVTHRDLGDLAENTEFLWRLNDIEDPYLTTLNNLLEERKMKVKGTVHGFIASAGKPRDLKITGTDERAGIDLFVNGRLREKDILKHMPTARLAESYLYGQVHYDALDDKEDRFTSSREGIIADDPKYTEFLAEFKKNVVSTVLEDWDEWRIKHRKAGDAENERLSPKERKSQELFNVVSSEYLPPKRRGGRRTKVDEWVDELSVDAQYNFCSYAECFVSENLIRKHIEENKISLSPEAQEQIKQYKQKEENNKGKGNISIPLRRVVKDLSYLSMEELAALVDKRKDWTKEACLLRDSHEYKPIRDALMHTALLTDVAKKKLTSVYENIKGRVKTLLS